MRNFERKDNYIKKMMSFNTPPKFSNEFHEFFKTLQKNKKILCTLVNYRALQNVDQKTLDLTNWLEYFVEGVYVNTQAVKERVIKLSSERLKKTRRGQIALTERQMRIIEFINKNGRITNRDIRSMFKLSDESALREINKLLSLGVIKKRGKGRATHYIIK